MFQEDVSLEDSGCGCSSYLSRDRILLCHESTQYTSLAVHKYGFDFKIQLITFKAIHGLNCSYKYFHMNICKKLTVVRIILD